MWAEGKGEKKKEEVKQRREWSKTKTDHRVRKGGEGREEELKRRKKAMERKEKTLSSNNG